METYQALILGSGHHAHLKQEDFEILFGPGAELTPKRQLNADPRGGFLSNQKVEVVGPKGRFTASILGPVRSYTQVEISYTDAQLLGIRPKMSDSGILEGTAPCTLIGPAGQLELQEGLMVVRRHVHLDPLVGGKLGVKAGDMLRVRIPGPRALVFEQVAIAKGFPGVQSIMHLDYDELNAAGVAPGEQVMGTIEYAHDTEEA